MKFVWKDVLIIVRIPVWPLVSKYFLQRTCPPETYPHEAFIKKLIFSYKTVESLNLLN